MHTSDQSPEENQLPEQQSPEVDAQLSSSSADTSRAADEDAQAPRQEQAYPPKPSFYEQALSTPGTAEPPVPGAVPVSPAQRPEMPPIQPAPSGEWRPPLTPGQQYPAYPQGAYMPPPGYPAYPQGGYYPGTQPPPFMPAPPPARKSRSWLWILISILLVVILGSCGLCTWAVGSSVGPIFSQTFSAASDGTKLINDYYEAIQNQHYSQAYADLNTQDTLNGLSQEQFTALASKQDDSYGAVLRYTMSQLQPMTSDNNGPSLDSFSVIVKVSRTKKSYTAHLTIKQINNQWKIVDYDQL
ncbi:hypothetical protein KDW_24250 [Dictyobacter vulcani]|uniref:DUF4878 domain-containing protein n=1 Tax=Dictyobacter vulcani TaxID=2607529 RepID=A0A5J4KKE8_9CHLR|nr:hypothetical protein [Dictyobacter vulcani]GER88263.1 hypothetical protein KDW_24250 [Dictyobacter vulcani]